MRELLPVVEKLEGIIYGLEDGKHYKVSDLNEYVVLATKMKLILTGDKVPEGEWKTEVDDEDVLNDENRDIFLMYFRPLLRFFLDIVKIEKP